MYPTACWLALVHTFSAAVSFGDLLAFTISSLPSDSPVSLADFLVFTSSAMASSVGGSTSSPTTCDQTPFRWRAHVIGLCQVEYVDGVSASSLIPPLLVDSVESLTVLK